MADPVLPLEVNGVSTMALVDTGATRSSVNMPLPQTSMSTDSIPLVGFSGKPLTLPLTKPLPTILAGFKFEYRFVHSPRTPMCLLGRDILTQARATMLCGPQGL